MRGGEGGYGGNEVRKGMRTSVEGGSRTRKEGRKSDGCGGRRPGTWFQGAGQKPLASWVQQHLLLTGCNVLRTSGQASSVYTLANASFLVSGPAK